MIVYKKCKIYLSLEDHNKETHVKKSVCPYCYKYKKSLDKGLNNDYCNMELSIIKTKKAIKNNPEYHATYYKNNKEHILKRMKDDYNKNSIKYKKKVKKYTKNNRGKSNSIKAKYRAAKLRATPKWLTSYQLNEIKLIYIEAIDLAWLNEGEVLQVDHIIPLQGKNVCGLHVPWNLQLLSKSKNCSKNNRFANDITS